ncbi:MAG TPA: CcmD family protein [Chitinophagaceae bacterium]|nr:CcmD family protein [Chitinophagaceae bacterium]
MSKFIALLVFTFFTLVLYAQNGTKDEPPQMANLMRSNGKIYVVVAVVVTILIGLFIYLISMDRKIGKLEKEKP